MDRFGSSMARSTADTTRGLLLKQDRLELAVIAHALTEQPEISGVAFYDPSENILAMSGAIERGESFTAHAQLEDTITGYVSLTLQAEAFASGDGAIRWLSTLVLLLLSPVLGLVLVQLTTRGSRSLPIVTVPDTPRRNQQSFCLVVNPYNLIGLSRPASQQVLADAMAMASEVCALHAGLAQTVGERGVLVLFDSESVTASQAVTGAFLFQQLLNSYETEGEFRCYLTTVHCPGPPAELEAFSLDMLGDQFDFEQMMTLASLAKPLSLLLDASVHAKLDGDSKTWTRPYNHPLLDEQTEATFEIAELPQPQAASIGDQQALILGFST